MSIWFRWCAEFEERNQCRVLRIVFAITLVTLPTVILVLGLVTLVPSNKNSPINVPKAEPLRYYDLEDERSKHEFLEVLKTSCVPPKASYISYRQRREVYEPQQDNENVSEVVIWATPENKDKAQFVSVQTEGNHIETTAKDNNDTRVKNTHHSYQNAKKIETSLNQSGGAFQDADLSSQLIPNENESGEKLEDSYSRGQQEVNELNADLQVPGCETEQYSHWQDVKKFREKQGRLMQLYMDTSVNPCEDFYQYACGNWAKHNPIPKDKAAFDTFEVLRESLDTILRELLTEQVTSNDTTEAHIKAKYLYQSCMEQEILEERREGPLMLLLEQLGGWPIISSDWNQSAFDWLDLAAQLRTYNNDVLISEWVGPDIKNSEEYIIQIDQTSLGMPTRDYFLDVTNAVYLEAYREYMANTATLLGADLEKVTREVSEMIAFEQALAKITASVDERRNVSELYRRMTAGELQVTVPQIDWNRYLTTVTGRQINSSEPVVIFALGYMHKLVVLLHQTPPRTLANYLLWRFVRHRVNNLDDRFQKVKQRFYFVLFGREESPPRWKNCVSQVNSNMGMVLGAMFIRKYFDETSKNDTVIITKEIQMAFNEILNKTTWIDIDTKNLAWEKVNEMTLRIGYPDYIIDPNQLNTRYKDVDIKPKKYFENTLNVLRHLNEIEQSNLGRKVNKSMWNTAPAVVNAYYSRNKNQIMVPAGILQPPFYHRYFPRSLNYGGIGVVIGHEITHGFDDKGRLFDKNGNLHRWWNEEVIKNFHGRAECLIEQYSKYRVEDVGIHVDGITTQGENIADNGGIKQAFRAYKYWQHKYGCGAEDKLPGLNATGTQLFFLNFAQVWCGNTRPEASRNKMKVAVHSPGRFRVIGTLSNSKDFSRVFDCPIGSAMNPKEKCTVW